MSDTEGTAVGGLSWDEAWANVKDSVTGPIVRIVSALFGLVTTALDALQLIVTGLGLGGGVIEQWLQEFKVKWEGEITGFEEEIGDTVSPGVKAAFVAIMAAVGVELDHDEPLSAESITNVVNRLINYPVFRNVFDDELLKEDLLTLGGLIIETKTGIPVDLNDEESIGNFAAALIVGAVQGYLGELDVRAICPGVNTVAGVLCKTQNCHACMDDEEDCRDRRERQTRNRGKYQRECTRTPR